MANLTTFFRSMRKVLRQAQKGYPKPIRLDGPPPITLAGRIRRNNELRKARQRLQAAE